LSVPFLVVAGSGAEPRLVLTSTRYLAVFLSVSCLIVSHSNLDSPCRFTVGSPRVGMGYTVFVVVAVGSSIAVSILLSTRERVPSNSIQEHSFVPFTLRSLIGAVPNRGEAFGTVQSFMPVNASSRLVMRRAFCSWLSVSLGFCYKNRNLHSACSRAVVGSGSFSGQFVDYWMGPLISLSTVRRR